MTEQWSLLVLVLAVGAGLTTVTATSVLARSRQTALFRYLQLQVLLFNLLILAGLVVQYLSLPVDGRPGLMPLTMIGLLAAMVPLKLGWLYAFAAMTLVLPGQELAGGFRRIYARGALVLVGAGILAVAIAATARLGTLTAIAVLATIEAGIVGGALAACAHLLARVRALPTGPRRRSVAMLGWAYLAVFVAMLASLVLGWFRPPPPAQGQLINATLMIVCNLLPLVWTLRFQPRGAVSTTDAMKRYGISAREREIIALISAGCTNQEVADRLFISLATVKDHNYNIFRKLGVRNRVELVTLVRPDGNAGGT